MIVCGLKLTHDGSIALLDGDRLVFSVEMEKRANGKRYSEITDLAVVADVLADFGYSLSDVNEWVVDGWDGDQPGFVVLEVLDEESPVRVPVGPYRESDACPDLLQPALSNEFALGGGVRDYRSFTHAAGHVVSAYCTSPFAERGEPSFVLVWDGGLFPRLYWADPRGGVRNLGALFGMIGHSYATAAHHFGPYRRETQSPTVDDLTVAGKLMAYVALGKAQEPLLGVLREAFHTVFESELPESVRYRETVGGFGSLFELSMPPVHAFYDRVRAGADAMGASDDDVLAAVHEFFGELLTTRLAEKIRAYRGEGTWNLCFAGGCALNIKWNSALRALPEVREMWVPPFPNDSGSAIGAAALGRGGDAALRAVEWDVRSGPALVRTESAHATGWSERQCSPRELAALLHDTGKPVVVLHGRAELGPRALGGRSILAAAVDPAMKELLNDVKGREWYRPVAPVCLQEQAPDVFDPGTPDPYMLFEHTVRPDWLAKVPAIVHLDGTARLQTVGPQDDPLLGEVLAEYHRLSGIPLLCNTSANFNGSGFFPDVASAMRWGRVDAIWSEGRLFQRTAR